MRVQSSSTLSPRERYTDLALQECDEAFEKADYMRALKAAERANQLTPGLVKALLRISEIYVKQEKYAEALPYLKQINELEPTNPKKDYLLGRVYYLVGETQDEYEKSAFYLGRAAEAFQNIKNSMYTLHAGLADTIAAIDDKNIESAKRRNSRAVQYFHLAIEENVFDKPTDIIVAYLYRAQAYYGLGKYAESVWDMVEAKKQLNVHQYPKLNPIWEEVQGLLIEKGYGEKLSKLLGANEKLAELNKQLEWVKKASQENNRHIDTTKNEIVALREQIKDKENLLVRNIDDISSIVQENKKVLQGTDSMLNLLRRNEHPIHQQHQRQTTTDNNSKVRQYNSYSTQ